MFSGIFFFCKNLENEKVLTKLICYHFQTDWSRSLFGILLIITRGKNTLRITKERIEVLPISIHDEADTRLIFDARICNEAVVIFGKMQTHFYF